MFQVIFITEYMSSGSLKQFLKRTKRNVKKPPLQAWKRWCTQILSALRFVTQLVDLHTSGDVILLLLLPFLKEIFQTIYFKFNRFHGSTGIVFSYVIPLNVNISDKVNSPSNYHVKSCQLKKKLINKK